MALVAAAVLSPACIDAECNPQPILVHAVEVRLVDEQTGEEVCDAKVTIANRVTATPEASSACAYSGGSGPGTYRVSVEREGYRRTDTVVDVPGDSCDVGVSKQVTLELEPE